MDQNDITERFEALETAIDTQRATLRRQRLVIGGLVLAVLSAVVMGAAPQSRDATLDTVTANKIEIKDNAGNSAVVLESDKTGGSLTIYNAAGESVAGLYNAENGGTLGIVNTAGTAVAVLGGTEKGAYLTIRNKNSEEVIQLGVDEYGNGSVGVFDRKGDGRKLKPGP